MIKQRTFLREERRQLRITTEKLEERKRAIKFITQKDWLCDEFRQTKDEKKVKINVGGILFEAYESTLKRDPKSLLNQVYFFKT